MFVANSAESETYIYNNITSDTTWTLAGSPYIISDCQTIRVRPQNPGDPMVTLTIEPGVEVLFGPPSECMEATLIIGDTDPNLPATLIARGTSEERIRFNAVNSPFYYEKGFDPFHNTGLKILESSTSNSALEYCTFTNVQVGVEVRNTNPSIQFNEFINNSSAIRLSSANATIYSNTLENNYVGVDIVSSDQSTIECNNFFGNSDSIRFQDRSEHTTIVNNSFSCTGERDCIAVYCGEEGGCLLTCDDLCSDNCEPGCEKCLHCWSINASNNYWTQANPYNASNVNILPRLSSSPSCVPEISNVPPNAPEIPDPADGSTNIGGSWEGRWRTGISWQCTDPDSGDILNYSLSLGETPDSLALITDEPLRDPNYEAYNLRPETTYYWQVIARDQRDAETTGPIWHFTTAASPIDLYPSVISWTPETGILGNDRIGFTADIQKTGEGSIGRYCRVDFLIDGESIGYDTVHPTTGFDANGVAQATRYWDAKWGQHTIEVVVDSLSRIDESNETNNNLSASLPEIIDPAPPVLDSSNPLANQHLQAASTVSLTLRDVHGEIDVAAVRNTIAVTRDGDSIDGVVTDVTTDGNTTFTFTPTDSPLPDGDYTVNFSAVDTAGNTGDTTLTFTVDSVAPSAPQVDPVTSPTHNASPLITGTKGAYDAIWLTGQMVVAHTMGTTWQCHAPLESGPNTLVFTARDRAGNEGPPAEVTIVFDDISPLPVDTLTVNGERL